MEEPKAIRLGNVYDDEYGTGYAGNVWNVSGICPTLTTLGGGNRQPMVIVEVEDE